MRNSCYVSVLSLVLVLVLGLAGADYDLASDRAALIAFRSAVGNNRLYWNLSEPSPCSWPGVSCNTSPVRRVRILDLGAATDLSGQIPSNTLGKLTSLVSLDLGYSNLSGQLPSDMANLKALRHISIPGNSFSGDIPAFLFTFRGLLRIDIGHNRFTGPVSHMINNLSKLQGIYMDNNMLTGSIPRLQSNALMLFSVPNNQLTGVIPELNFPALLVLDLSGNRLSGRFPMFEELNRIANIYLQNNTLTGTIPELNLTTLLYIDVSFNRLRGRIPASLQDMHASSFQGNSLCGTPLPACS